MRASAGAAVGSFLGSPMHERVETSVRFRSLLRFSVNDVAIFKDMKLGFLHDLSMKSPVPLQA
jgi:hypothetical protein